MTPSCRAPVFIACGARSGSTLLRRLLNGHSDVACPSETDLAELIEAYVRTGSVLAAEDPASADGLHPTLCDARNLVDGLARRYLEREGKTRWCDKSLSNVLHLDMLASTWPDAQFILLHRHVMDFAASSLDAQPWGLTDYGFAQFGTEAPGDSVSALVAYWLDRTWRMLVFEERHRERCLRLRYEDLVARTDAELTRVWTFLDVQPEQAAVSRAFSDPRRDRPNHSVGGRGDYKTWYTDSVHEESVGCGTRIPVQGIKPAVLKAVNKMGHHLGYAPVGQDWGAGGSIAGRTTRPPLLEVRVVRGHSTIWAGTAPLPPGVNSPAVAAIDEDAVNDLREARRNPADLTRSRRLRYYGPPLPDTETDRALIKQVLACLEDAP